MFFPRNIVELSGVITQLDVLRRTPAGVLIRSGILNHQSSQHEGGAVVALSFSLPFMAIGEVLSYFERDDCIGKNVVLSGFVALVNNRRLAPVFTLRVCCVSFFDTLSDESVQHECEKT